MFRCPYIDGVCLQLFFRPGPFFPGNSISLHPDLQSAFKRSHEATPMKQKRTKVKKVTIVVEMGSWKAQLRLIAVSRNTHPCVTEVVREFDSCRNL